MNQIFLKTIDSTNTYAKLHASQFPNNEITCIVADEQTGGRGRQDRSWLSPPGVNLYVTFYFRLPLLQPDFMTLGLVLASSMATVLTILKLQPQIKWPNDLHLSGKKMGGILCETSVEDKTFNVFAGIGINVNMELSDFQKIGQPATSLKEETGKLWDREQILESLQVQFTKDLEIFKEKGFEPFYALCETLLAYKGETVRCVDGKKEWIGLCKSLAKDGRLNIELPNGSIRTFTSGEISIRKKIFQ